MLLVLLQLPSNKEKEAAQIWNKIITSFQVEDLINNRKMNLLIAPQSVDRELDLIPRLCFFLQERYYWIAGNYKMTANLISKDPLNTH
ncbi:hypothetical protein E3N88_10598 [Mikania micrantha]|uniref:Uncharacterized protein n=1 Tax=Mikania micrantha TaxID=192012 RepID=A0A5N6PDB6_9ASTR|nr:hypothetical protein E3N88_10598 [Mikania micrantha]